MKEGLARGALAAALVLTAAACTDPLAVVQDPNADPAFLVSVSTHDAAGGPANVFAPGEPVTLRVTVVNTTDAPQTLTFSSSQVYDFVVRDDKGAEIWRWSLDEAFTPATERIDLGPREERSYEEVWPQRAQDGSAVPPGEYVLVGGMTDETPGTTSASQVFTIK